jgi:hypothetical protein
MGLSAGLLSLALTAAAAEPPSHPPAGRPTIAVLNGTTLLLTEVLKSSRVSFDRAPIEVQVVLRVDDGTIVPLLSDVPSRALFQDERLRHRKTEIRGRRYPGLPYLEVVSFRVEEQGRLQTPEYYCEICTISVRFPQICPCCQGDMVLRMRPER